MGLSAGIANAAFYDGNKGCARSQVGVVGVAHVGAATLVAPGSTQRRSFFNSQMKWSEDWANRSGGGYWSVTVHQNHTDPQERCEIGNP